MSKPIILLLMQDYLYNTMDQRPKTQKILLILINQNFKISKSVSKIKNSLARIKNIPKSYGLFQNNSSPEHHLPLYSQFWGNNH